jgi:DNA-binding NarL/FixJ family response regulator
MKTVLIVDDHPSCRAFARALLQAEGFEVVGEAGDGATALEAARTLRPELVLLDVQLPDMDGFAVASQLTSWERAPAVVLMSSRSADDYGPLVEQSGARGFVPKHEISGPALLRELIHVVE